MKILDVKIPYSDKCRNQLGFILHETQICAAAAKEGEKNFLESDVSIKYHFRSTF